MNISVKAQSVAQLGVLNLTISSIENPLKYAKSKQKLVFIQYVSNISLHMHAVFSPTELTISPVSGSIIHCKQRLPHSSRSREQRTPASATLRRRRYCVKSLFLRKGGERLPFAET